MANEDASHDYINILLLGETGVGKSTFINAFGYYLRFKSFEEAAQSDDLELLIPATFTVTDKDYEQIKITIGSDDNEEQTVGAAGTQNVKTYTFPIGSGKTVVRLIDSPGMGDPRGIEQDDRNCENILAYLSHLKELHAICFLFKPTNTRLTVLFEYCIKQLLSRLEKSASQNIIFIFTNTRATFYTPGDTMPCLKSVIADIKSKPPNVEIPLKGNIFCLDNEAFKYLLAKRTGIEFTEEVEKLLIESWKFSVEACWKLISYIVGDESHAPLKPHQLFNTDSINKARTMIVQLSQPLADISQLISDNILLLERHKRNLTDENQSLKNLKKNLYIPVINLEVTELPNPVTVCTSRKCAEIVKVGEVNKWHYRQRCHDPCGLDNVPKELIGDPNLLGCTAMNGTRNCTVCKCDFTVHMHVYYETETVQNEVVNNDVKANITKKEEALRECERLIEEIDQRKGELETEYEVINQSMAMFAHFLQYNALSPFNDSYKAYIEYLISREKSLGEHRNVKLINNWETLLRRYEEMKAAFKKSLQFNQETGTFLSTVTAKNVLDAVDCLFELEHNGSKIKELIKKQNSSRSSEYYNSCKSIKYTIPMLKTHQSGKKAESKDGNNKKHEEAEESGNNGNSTHDERNGNAEAYVGSNNRRTTDESTSQNILKRMYGSVKRTVSGWSIGGLLTYPEP